MNRRIFLIGYMGSGKSTLGPRLARELGLTFIDLDKAIEQKEGMTIGTIFTNRGEDIFRQLERRELHRILDTEKEFVLASGGGTPCYADNMDCMQKAGLTIYLEMPVRALWQRIRQSQTERPLMANMVEEEQLAFIEKHLLQRTAFYDRATLTVNGIGADAKAVARMIREIEQKPGYSR